MSACVSVVTLNCESRRVTRLITLSHALIRNKKIKEKKWQLERAELEIKER